MPRQTQTRLRQFFVSRLFLFSVLMVAVVFAFGFARAYYQDYKVRQEIRNLQEQVKKLEAKRIESMEILKYVTSPGFVEEKARTELNMKKPGEQVLMINNLEEDSKTETVSGAEESERLNNPSKWWYYFTHQNVIN